MDIAMIGLGKMGANMTTRLLHGGHRVVVYDLNESAIREAEDVSLSYSSSFYEEE